MRVVQLASERERLKIVADYYRVRADKYEVLGTLPQSERTFVISGYIPEAVAGSVADGLMKKYDCMVDVEELKEDEWTRRGANVATTNSVPCYRGCKLHVLNSNVVDARGPDTPSRALTGGRRISFEASFRNFSDPRHRQSCPQTLSRRCSQTLGGMKCS